MYVNRFFLFIPAAIPSRWLPLNHAASRAHLLAFVTHAAQFEPRFANNHAPATKSKNACRAPTTA